MFPCRKTWKYRYLRWERSFEFEFLFSPTGTSYLMGQPCTSSSQGVFPQGNSFIDRGPCCLPRVRPISLDHLVELAVGRSHGFGRILVLCPSRLEVVFSSFGCVYGSRVASPYGGGVLEFPLERRHLRRRLCSAA